MLKNSEDTINKLQLAPKYQLYKEKFGENRSYDSKDFSSDSYVTNVRINELAGVSEPRIVCNPRNKNFLAVSANNYSEKENLACVFISDDGGMNWKEKNFPLSSKFKMSSYSDPWTDYDSEGNLYFVAVQGDLSQTGREGIYIARSSDNGNSWRTDLNFVDYNGKEKIEIDRPKIFIDKSSANKNTIYVSWIEVKGFSSYIMFAKSSDGGFAFSNPVSLEKNDVEFCSLSSDYRGFLYLVYLKDENKISIKKSTDKGANWINNFADINIKPAGKNYDNQYLIKNSDNNGIRINSEPSVTTGKDELMITYSASGTGNDQADIYFVKININTSEISDPVRVNADKTSSDQFLPCIATDESNNIIIIYQDSRNDPNNILTETFASFSGDGGRTFTDKLISTKSFDPMEISIDKYIGDYNSCVLGADKLIAVWTDGRNKNLDIYSGIINVKAFNESTNH